MEAGCGRKACAADKGAEGATNRRKGDFWYLLPTHSVVLEVDERFHSLEEVSCEVSRIWDLKDQNPLAMYLIRYNPHWPFRPDKLDVLLSRVRYALLNHEVASNAFGGVFIEYLGYPLLARCPRTCVCS